MAEKPSELDETTQGTPGLTWAEPSVDLAHVEMGAPEPAAQIPDDPDAIREQIEETRRGMGETLDAIQEKLSPSHIAEQVKEQVTEQITEAVETLKTTVSEAVVGKAGRFMKNIGKEVKKLNLGQMAGDNPLPLVLIGLGLGMLAVNKYRGNASRKYAKYRYRRNAPDSELQQQTDEPSTGGISQKVSDSASSAYANASGAANKVYESASGAASSVYARASGAANKVYESASGAAGGAYDKIGDFGGQLRDQYDYQLAENPLVVGAVALALGAAVGWAMPATRYEGELMGEARAKLVSKAQTAARDAFGKVQEVVGQAKETIVEDAKQVVSQAQESLSDSWKTEDSERPAHA